MDFINNKERNFKPVKSLVFYERETEYSGTDVYAEVAKIENGVAKSYSPLCKDALKDIAKSVEQTIGKEDSEFSFSKFDSEREILFAEFKDDSLSATWFIKKAKRMYETKNYKGVITYPNLILKFSNNKLYIYSTKISNLNLDTVIYKAPFPNIYDNGAMCFGSMSVNKLKSNNLELLIKNMENSFFNSRFNALMSQNRTISNTYNLFEELVKNKGEFPNKELVKTKLKLKDVYR